MRWALPDRVFFACGACHILTYSFLDRYEGGGARALWIRPGSGFTGNHIVVSGDGWVFDYHGFSDRDRFMDHLFRRAQHYWPGWHADLVPLPAEVLVSERKSRAYPGLWLREPGQFLHDAMPRAWIFRDRLVQQSRRCGTLPDGVS